MGQDFRKFIAEGDLDFVNERYISRQKGGEVPSVYELRSKRKDGELRWGITSISSVIDSSGQFKIIGQYLDITEQKLIEEKLKDSEERYRSLIEASPDAILVTDLQGTILMINQKGIKMYAIKKVSKCTEVQQRMK
jgi:PAS domain-containing protein